MHEARVLEKLGCSPKWPYVSFLLFNIKVLVLVRPFNQKCILEKSYTVKTAFVNKFIPAIFLQLKQCSQGLHWTPARQKHIILVVVDYADKTDIID